MGGGVSTLARMVWGTYFEKNCPCSKGHMLGLGGSEPLPRWFGALMQWKLKKRKSKSHHHYHSQSYHLKPGRKGPRNIFLIGPQLITGYKRCSLERNCISGWRNSLIMWSSNILNDWLGEGDFLVRNPMMGSVEGGSIESMVWRWSRWGEPWCRYLGAQSTAAPVWMAMMTIMTMTMTMADADNWEPPSFGLLLLPL